MKKKYRLRKRSDFDEIFEKGKSIKTSNLIFLYIPEKSGNKEKNQNSLRIGVRVPKKKCKRAVDRNYLKRVIWATHSKLNLEELPPNSSIFLYTSFFLSKFSKVKKINFLDLERDVKKIYNTLSKRCS
ncbi:Ribonuclease P [Mycoplasma suis KI3806]|uniref:Ribonuclease P protein component n=1 Tax=Mycoplasma suis (strain KI_3806) TaxID=708248 RepID=F0V2M2_MYCS3|nr:ribonuclease P protein component [Mycoplasma suis]CBZ40094.1 Ribonuclease P [Mycoplasma suis KI3806]